MNWFIRVMDEWRHLSHKMETALLDIVSATTPWLAPILPAYFAFDGLLNARLVPPSLAAIAGAVIEFLGLVTISTTIQFWDFNGYLAERQANAPAGKKGRRQGSSRKNYRAPVIPAALAACYYVIIVLVVNVLLDLEASFIEKIVKALLSTLSIVGAVTLALRSQHSRKVAALQAKKDQISNARKMKISEKSGVKVSENFTLPPRPRPSGRLDWRRLPIEDKARIAGMTLSEIVDQFNVDQRTAYNWMARTKVDTSKNENGKE